jgi:hypothetical protein
MASSFERLLDFRADYISRKGALPDEAFVDDLRPSKQTAG